MMNSTWLQSEAAQSLLGALGVVILVLLFDRVFKHLLQNLLLKISGERGNWFYTFLRDRKFVFWVLSLPYLAIVYHGLKWIPDIPERLREASERLIAVVFVIFCLLILTQVLRIMNEIYMRSNVSRLRPIKGYLQTIALIAYLFGFVLILAIVIDRSPLLLLSGLGAMTAVLLLVFKDTILSFVAGIQLTANDLLRVGDWIEMPQFNADGDVMEIALHTVKVQNWDKTVSVIPAHRFLEHSFKNWRGMQDAGGRRIKRALNIDVTSIHFLSGDQISQLSKINILKPYLAKKLEELSQANSHTEESYGANQRRLTNIGTFRAYVTAYLEANPKIHRDLTFLVRQLAPGPEGLPLEIYVFSNDIEWTSYEAIQSDIFDHLFAVMSEFGLRPYQKPSGFDLAAASLV